MMELYETFVALRWPIQLSSAVRTCSPAPLERRRAPYSVSLHAVHILLPLLLPLTILLHTLHSSTTAATVSSSLSTLLLLARLTILPGHWTTRGSGRASHRSSRTSARRTPIE